MLQKVAERLKSILRETDTIARVGGDEFLLLMPEATGKKGGTRVAQKIIRAFQEPFIIGDQRIRSTVSMGIALYPTDGQDQDTLIMNADIAMYQAKEKGRNNFQYFQGRAHLRDLPGFKDPEISR